MGCQNTKCRSCEAYLPACQLTNGYCPLCWGKVQQGISKAIKFIGKCFRFS